MGIPMNHLTTGLSTEIIYSFAIIFCSLMIYFGTKELDELSSHKGIRYFRNAFLFFAIAYFFRSFIKFILIYFEIPKIIDIRFLDPLFGQITLGIFIYFSAMAIFYLLYSVMWKRWKDNFNKINIFHAISLIVAIAITIFPSSKLYLIINFLLLFFVIFTFLMSRKHLKKKHTLRIIYPLLFSFWTLNIIDILIPNFFDKFQLFLYLTSLSIFFVISYKVIRNTGAN